MAIGSIQPRVCATARAVSQAGLPPVTHSLRGTEQTGPADRRSAGAGGVD